MAKEPEEAEEERGGADLRLFVGKKNAAALWNLRKFFP
jgi:hypothetical protein